MNNKQQARDEFFQNLTSGTSSGDMFDAAYEYGFKAGVDKLRANLGISGISTVLVADTGYDKLVEVMSRAHDHAARGKGKERHANDLPFEQQRMLSIARGLKSPPDSLAYQVIKKVTEGLQMSEHGRTVGELLGAINYIAGIVILLDEREAAKPQPATDDTVNYAKGGYTSNSPYDELAQESVGETYESVLSKTLLDILFGVQTGACGNPDCPACNGTESRTESSKVLTDELAIPDLTAINPRRFQYRIKKAGQGIDDNWQTAPYLQFYKEMQASGHADVRIISHDQLQEDEKRAKANVIVVDIVANTGDGLTALSERLAGMIATRNKSKLH